MQTALRLFALFVAPRALMLCTQSSTGSTVFWDWTLSTTPPTTTPPGSDTFHNAFHNASHNSKEKNNSSHRQTGHLDNLGTMDTTVLNLKDLSAPDYIAFESDSEEGSSSQGEPTTVASTAGSQSSSLLDSIPLEGDSEKGDSEEGGSEKSASEKGGSDEGGSDEGDSSQDGPTTGSSHQAISTFTAPRSRYMLVATRPRRSWTLDTPDTAPSQDALYSPKPRPRPGTLALDTSHGSTWTPGFPIRFCRSLHSQLHRDAASGAC